MDERGAGFRLNSRANFVARGNLGFTERDFPAVRFDRADLHLRGVFGHHDKSGNAAPSGSAGHRGTVIAARLRDDALCGFFLGQCQDSVAGAANLEGAGLLQIFALKEEARARDGIKRRGSEHRGAVDTRSDAGVSVENGLPGKVRVGGGGRDCAQVDDPLRLAHYCIAPRLAKRKRRRESGTTLPY